MLRSYQDPTNHTVPILDVFADTQDDSISYIVMPFLQPVDDPPFYVIEEILNFADQILEGLVFMHSKGVAHRHFIHIPVENISDTFGLETALRRTF